MRLEARLAALPACYQRALGLAAGLSALARVRVNPSTPQANMMHVFFDAPAEAVTARRDEIAASDGVWVINDPRPADTPGWCVSELYVGDALAELEDAAVLPRFASLLG
jgi:hypothetical protein